MVTIIKRSGEKEVFLESKVRQSLRRSGVNRQTENKIVKKLTQKLHEGMTTEEIYRLVYRWLSQEQISWASKYNLKQAIMNLGPTGYPFEIFLARLLAACDFETKTSQILSGHCVKHEVDIIAKTSGFDCLEQKKQCSCYLIECKFHNRGGIKVALKTVLYIWARFLDLRDTPINCFGQIDQFSRGLLATNTKITSEALKYCQCVGLAVLSWNYPKNNSLPDLINRNRKHPITCLKSLSSQDRQSLLKEGLVFCQDLLDNHDWTAMIGRKSKKIIIEAEAIITD